MGRPFYRRKRFWGALLTVVLLVFIYLYRAEIPGWLQRWHWADIQQSVRDTGPWAPLICILLLALFTVFFLPTTVIVVLAGLLYGVAVGALICLAGFVLGMSTAFLLARTLLHDRVRRRFGQHPLYLRIQGHIQRDGWKIIVFMRMLPVNPYPLLNYLFALCPISYPVFILSSTIGILPNLLVFLLTTHAAGEMASGKLDMRVAILLGCGALLFAFLAFLPRLLRRKLPDVVENHQEPQG